MKKIYSALLLLVFALGLQAQTFIGYVRRDDAEGDIIYQAQVSVYNNDKLLFGLKTYFDGSYRFPTTKNQAYTVKVGYPGYADTVFVVKADKTGKPNPETNTVKLHKDGMRLLGVIRNKSEEFPIAGATIVLKNVMTRQEKRITTGIDGYYNFKLEYETNYRVSIDKRSPGIVNKYRDTAFYISTVGFNLPLDYKLDISLESFIPTSRQQGYKPRKQIINEFYRAEAKKLNEVAQLDTAAAGIMHADTGKVTANTRLTPPAENAAINAAAVAFDTAGSRLPAANAGANTRAGDTATTVPSHSNTIAAGNKPAAGNNAITPGDTGTVAAKKEVLNGGKANKDSVAAVAINNTKPIKDTVTKKPPVKPTVRDTVAAKKPVTKSAAADTGISVKKQNAKAPADTLVKKQPKTHAPDTVAKKPAVKPAAADTLATAKNNAKAKKEEQARIKKEKAAAKAKADTVVVETMPAEATKKVEQPKQPSAKKLQADSIAAVKLAEKEQRRQLAQAAKAAKQHSRDSITESRLAAKAELLAKKEADKNKESKVVVSDKPAKPVNAGKEAPLKTAAPVSETLLKKEPKKAVADTVAKAPVAKKELKDTAALPKMLLDPNLAGREDSLDLAEKLLREKIALLEAELAQAKKDLHNLRKNKRSGGIKSAEAGVAKNNVPDTVVVETVKETAPLKMGTVVQPAAGKSKTGDGNVAPAKSAPVENTNGPEKKKTDKAGKKPAKDKKSGGGGAPTTAQKLNGVIFYARNSEALSKEGKRQLSDLVSALKENPDLRIKLYSMASADEINPVLISSFRLNGAFDYITGEGIEKGRLDCTSYNTKRARSTCTAANCPEDQLKLNRCVVFELIKP